MGKIEIICDIKGNTVNDNTIYFKVNECNENDLANALREIFSTVINNKLVRPNILAQVLLDISADYFKMFKSGLGA